MIKLVSLLIRLDQWQALREAGILEGPEGEDGKFIAVRAGKAFPAPRQRPAPAPETPPEPSEASGEGQDTPQPENEPQTPEGEPGNAPFEALVEEIYENYPRKIGKPNALKAIRACLRRNKLDAQWSPTAILAATSLFDDMIKLEGLDRERVKQMTPHTATWFNQDRFKDGVEEWLRPLLHPWQTIKVDPAGNVYIHTKTRTSAAD